MKFSNLAVGLADFGMRGLSMGLNGRATATISLPALSFLSYGPPRARWRRPACGSMALLTFFDALFEYLRAMMILP